MVWTALHRSCQRMGSALDDLPHNGLSIRYGAEIFPMTPKGELAGGNVSPRVLLPALAAFAAGLLLARGSGDEGGDNERAKAGP